jgi:hypothetical protein
MGSISRNLDAAVYHARTEKNNLKVTGQAVNQESSENFEKWFASGESKIFRISCI